MDNSRPVAPAPGTIGSVPTEPQCPPAQPTLPAVLQLPPHRSVFRLGQDGRLLGLDPDVALAVDRLEPALAAMVDELTGPVPASELVDRAVRRGAAPELAEQLLRALVGAGALVDGAEVERRDRQRADSTVLVSGAGPLAVGVVLGLVHAGVGRVLIETAGSVLAGDLGTGHVDGDRGHERADAIRAAVRRVHPDAKTPAPPGRRPPDLVVLADALAPDPVRVAGLQATGVAHLPVRMRDGIGLVGPLVRPGRTACLGCLEQQRCAFAPGWQIVAAQLIGQCGRADPAATTATAALGVAQALAALDSTGSGGARPPTWEATLELDTAVGTLRRRRWRPQVSCGCGADRAVPGGLRHDGATSADPRPRERIMV